MYYIHVIPMLAQMQAILHARHVRQKPCKTRTA